MIFSGLPQACEVRLDPTGPAEVPVAGLTAADAQSIAQPLRCLAERVAPGMLVEFIVGAEKGILFVDAKAYNYPLRFRLLVQGCPPGTVLYGNALPAPSAPYDGSFDVATATRVSPLVIRLANRAALCHFVTYSLRHGVTTILS